MSLIKLFIKREINSKYLEKITLLIIKDYEKLKKKNKHYFNSKYFLIFFRFNIYKFNNYLWKNLILSISNRQNVKFQENIINEIKKVKIKSLSLNDLNILYLICLRLGIYTIANSLRKIIIVKTFHDYKNNKKNQLLLLKTINALIELRQFKTARKLTTEIKSVYEKNLLTVYLCNFQKTRIPNKQMSFLQDFYPKNFQILTHLKNILVICPSMKKNYLNVNNFDLVVGMNYFNKKNINNLQAKRCDLSYLSTEQGNYFLGNSSLDKDVFFYITRSSKMDRLFKAYYKNYCSRYTLDFKKLMFRGNLNLMPNIILDLLLSPKKMKKLYIHNSDLMLTVKRVKNYYPLQWNREKNMKNNFLVKMVNHDPITQFLFIKNCIKNNFISCDNTLLSIIEDGLDAYLKKIEKLYGVKI